MLTLVPMQPLHETASAAIAFNSNQVPLANRDPVDARLLLQ